MLQQLLEDNTVQCFHPHLLPILSVTNWFGDAQGALGIPVALFPGTFCMEVEPKIFEITVGSEVLLFR